MTAHTAQTGRTAVTWSLAAPSRWMANVRRDWILHRAYRATLAELQALTDRELADIGIGRLAIRDIARDAIYGK